MSIESLLSKTYAQWVSKKNKSWINNPLEAQKKTLANIVADAQNTAFGQDHLFNSITNYETFKKNVPVRDYEGLKPYVDRAFNGELNVLWPNLPLYFCKTSGTTSGSKYIPISKESLPFHLKGAKDAILSYISETGQTNFVGKQNIFIQGSPTLDQSRATPIGRLSGIVAHHLPWYLKKYNLPSFETNCIENWEEKIDKIVEETLNQDMGLISGIPPWVQMYFEKIQHKTNKPISEVFKNFSLLVYGGVDFRPYKRRFDDLIGKDIPSVETYPSSEGFIAYQDSQKEEGLLLCVNHGIFYEFIEASTYFDQNPKRLSLAEVKLGIDYAVVLNTNAGLWGYSIGDTVRFVSNKPYRIVVSGRIKHFTSAFGEHVIGKEVETAMRITTDNRPAIVKEFHVAPQVNPEEGLPYHEWFVDFEQEPEDLQAFSVALEREMQTQNSYYKDLVEGAVLKPLVVTIIEKNGFINYMKSIGKLGGQNKVPRLSNDRKIANSLTKNNHVKQ